MLSWLKKLINKIEGKNDSTNTIEVSKGNNGIYKQPSKFKKIIKKWTIIGLIGLLAIIAISIAILFLIFVFHIVIIVIGLGLLVFLIVWAIIHLSSSSHHGNDSGD